MEVRGWRQGPDQAWYQLRGLTDRGTHHPATE